MSKTQIKQRTCARIPTDAGDFELCYYSSNQDDKEHLALVVGDVNGQEGVLVRVHSECFTGDVLGSLRCDCGPQLRQSLKLIAAEGRGVLVYLRQEGRGIGLLDKLRAYNLQDDGFDTVDANLLLGHEADTRDYEIAALILQDLRVRSVRLLTNNPAKIEGLSRNGLFVEARMPLQGMVNDENAGYLKTKVERMHHMLDLDAFAPELSTNGTGATLPRPSTSGRVAAGRPFVTLSYAQSLDGSISLRRGEPLAISGPEAMEMTHHLRSQHDGILVGIGTVLADDPRLNVRLVSGPDPQAIVLDSRLRTPPDAHLFSGGRRPWIITTSSDGQRAQALSAAGARIMRFEPGAGNQIPLPDLLKHLHTEGLHTLMVEGGATVITSFLASGLVDRLVLTIAPLLVGGLHALQAPAVPNGRIMPALLEPTFRQLGRDLILLGDIQAT